MTSTTHHPNHRAAVPPPSGDQPRPAPTPGPGQPTPAPTGRQRPGLGARARAYWIGDLPSPWSEAPATLAELVRYARAGAWCAEDSVFLRFLGQAYCYCVAIPVTFKHYMQAWAVQRPGRFFAMTALVTVLKLSVGLAFFATLRFFVL